LSNSVVRYPLMHHTRGHKDMIQQVAGLMYITGAILLSPLVLVLLIITAHEDTET
jgi:hypothetical protein